VPENKVIFTFVGIVFPKYKTLAFVHGYFWHRHPRCRYAYQPRFLGDDVQAGCGSWP